MQEWWRLDDAAPWRLDRPGPSPFKRIGNPWSGLVPGADSPDRIKPDMVHTFHIGFGQDLAASCIVWLARLGLFGNRPFDERLRSAYSCFREFCHTEKRYTSCDQWCLKKLKMTSKLNCIIFLFEPRVWGKWLLWIIWCISICCPPMLSIYIYNKLYPEKLRTNDWPTSLAGKGHDTGVVCRWLEHFLRNTDP